jgi:hypothetical protein
MSFLEKKTCQTTGFFHLKIIFARSIYPGRIPGELFPRDFDISLIFN